MNRKRIVILGSGFAALSLVKKIGHDLYDISVVSPRNHFLFTPLLPSTTVGTIEFRSIIEPIRTANDEMHFYQAECVSISAESKSVKCRTIPDEEIFELPYDYLVVTVGAVNNTFGIQGVEEHALFLKELKDARAIRGRIIDNFERASAPNIPEEERKRLLHFVVVGGGPTGVEFAAELNDFVREDLVKWYPALIHETRITLLEASGQILSAFDSRLSKYAMHLFQRHSIDVRPNSPVKAVEEERIVLNDGTMLSCGLVVWSTGIGPTGLIRSLSFGKSRATRVLTDGYLRVVGEENIFAAGDCATPADVNYPATAQVAQQEGKYLARQFNRIARNKPVLPFRYNDLGMLAYIGGRRALADLPSVKGRGFITFLFWRSAYLTRLVSTKNKILVLFDWLKAFLFGRDISSF
jgi:NADH:quinone reductase (non-electrogenic)